MNRQSLQSLSARYLRTLGVVGVAIGVRLALEPVLENSGFAIFLSAVLLGAWVGGVGPSLLGQTILLLVQALWFSDSIEHPQITARGIVSISAYYFVGLAVAALSEARQAALQKVAAQNQKIENQQQELRATISGIGDGLLTIDRSGRINYLNPMAEVLTGWSADDARGESVKSVLQFKEGFAAADARSMMEKVLHAGKMVRETRVLRLLPRIGPEVPVTFNATPIQDHSGEILGAVIVIRNESERLQAEQQLREMNRRKDDFLATLAHELRNPLAPIRTGLELLKLSDGDQAVIDEVQDILQRQTQHMIRLVDDLLDVSRITRGKLQLRTTPINFGRVVQSAVETMRPLIEDFHHQLVLHVPENLNQIEGDPDRLTQIACNLLHNAIKYTPSGGVIQVDVSQDDHELLLAVKDNGRGISSDHLEAIFEMFNQGMEAHERGHSGLGIGLTLARRLAELHGGMIDVESPGLDRGSTFRLRLPLAAHLRPQEMAMPSATTAAQVPSRRRVLLVDDNRDILRTLKLMTDSLGCETRIAGNGVEALEIAALFRPEIVFMDLGMPGMNGYEAARRLRQEPWGKETFLVALTGWGQERERERTAAAGFDAHYVKPIDAESLRSCLERKNSSSTVLQPVSTAALSTTPHDYRVN